MVLSYFQGYLRVYCREILRGRPAVYRAAVFEDLPAAATRSVTIYISCMFLYSIHLSRLSSIYFYL